MPGPLPRTVRRHLSALRLLLVFTAVTGILYPLAVTGVAQLAFRDQADGSRIERRGRTVGSSLIGQNTGPGPQWFRPRPSAGGYDPLASGASNLGPNNPDLVKTVEQRRVAVAGYDKVDPEDVPVDAVTASGSGLDPHISPTYAYQQVNRVAKARGLKPATVRRLVAAHVQGRVLGFLGEKRVNVVELNAALADDR
ncbi:potassium-transporting ATPase subunit KdpC [Streptomyces sp. NBS 14/10]|uniref:potassium-transporting ATPase subunit KdpC n=1 Tax=Streptomyces sp. NBS 14/10 TaxID=1945643 RepID=UPI000B7C9266|nr:potassium-transporting ATPase subunit KdpC [Streptomyces sp. NBS 14/10]KAK1177302.1 potassium-transporting ATPase subunit KdpC [Streptomyces sp. NBS 14/10]NUP41865.1 potassium-transporting ATPase subunit KdpC [Streptomyces sp.]NUS86964.1 potassium-transporting ATPase subunit KdpC [Streptomyces sp.]